jgi:uncharacterized protein YjbI with pentapeptide repeats
MAPDPTDLGELQKALNDAAGKASILWTTFVTFSLYLMVAFGSVTNRDLFLENPIKLPLLNVELPLVGFFIAAPMILVILHFYVFLQLLALAAKSRDYDTLLRQVTPIASDRGYLRQRLDAFLVLQFLVGPKEQRTGVIGISLRLIAWLTLVGAPVVILIQGQVTFLPYHRESVAWLQRVILFVDIVVICHCWNHVRGYEDSMISFRTNKAWRIVGLVVGACVAGFSIFVVTFPGEATYKYRPDFPRVPTTWRPHWSYPNDWTSLHEFLFAGEPNEVRGRAGSPFSNRLVLTDQSFVDVDKLEKSEVSRYFRGRDLSQAVFNGADLRKADFTGAMLDGASFVGAKLQGTRFTCASIGEGVKCTLLRSADFTLARLEDASLESAQLQGAILDRADLKGANLLHAQLTGADLNEADLRGANLQGASLRGANLGFGLLQGANLDRADLQVSSLKKADLRGASLVGAALQGANFDDAQLQGATLANAKLWRAWGAPVLNLTDVDGVNWDEEPSASDWDYWFSDWRIRTLEQIPGYHSDELMMRMSVLDPGRRRPDNALDAKSWEKDPTARLRGEERDKALAGFLADLICWNLSYSARFVTRGLLGSKRIGAPNEQITLIIDTLRKGKSDSAVCPGVRGFTDDDWSRIDVLFKGAIP